MGGVQGTGQVQDHPRYLLSRCEAGRWPVLSLSRGLWRSLVSASVWGTEGRRFKSSQPDKLVQARAVFDLGSPVEIGLRAPLAFTVTI